MAELCHKQLVQVYFGGHTIVEYHINGGGLELTVNYAFSGLNLSRLSSLNGYFDKVFCFLLSIFHGIFFSVIEEGGISGNDEQPLCLLLGCATTSGSGCN